MKNIYKITLSIICIAIILVSFGTTVFATVTGVEDPSTLLGQDVQGTERITSIGNQLITVLTIVGTVASVIVLINSICLKVSLRKVTVFLLKNGWLLVKIV